MSYVLFCSLPMTSTLPSSSKLAWCHSPSTAWSISSAFASGSPRARTAWISPEPIAEFQCSMRPVRLERTNAESISSACFTAPTRSGCSLARSRHDRLMCAAADSRFSSNSGAVAGGSAALGRSSVRAINASAAEGSASPLASRSPITCALTCASTASSDKGRRRLSTVNCSGLTTGYRTNVAARTPIR